jgi:hypothetical protein
MANPPDRPGSSDPLEPVLRDVEAQLRDRLHEACEAESKGLATETSAEIRRLEDSLLAAAVAAEQTIALRRHIEQRNAEATRDRDTMQSESERRDEPNEAPILKVREFRDANGQLWRAWPVTPGQARQGRSAGRYLGDFHKGWICFEALEGTGRRRLPQQPAHWTDLQEAELIQLLEQAISAPERKLRSGDRKPDSIH